MPENPPGWFATLARAMIGQVERVGLNSAVCLSCGGLATLAGLSSRAPHVDLMIWFSAGFALPIGPLYLFSVSDRVLERRLI
jgi:hypothetical protein